MPCMCVCVRAVLRGCFACLNIHGSFNCAQVEAMFLKSSAQLDKDKERKSRGGWWGWVVQGQGRGCSSGA